MQESQALFVEYGTTTIPFLLQYSNRKTLGIAVAPNKEVIITAPFDASIEKILRKVAARASWISKQIRQFDYNEKKLRSRIPEYVSGETFYYLGRKYRLKVITGKEEGVKLNGRRLLVVVKNKGDQKRIKDLLMDWYLQRAKEVFKERFGQFQYILKREKVAVNQIFIRRLTRRWGSCTHKGKIILNLSLIQAPLKCIDYVLVHEICHLKYFNHGIKFYRLLNDYFADWEIFKRKLVEVCLL